MYMLKKQISPDFVCGKSTPHTKKKPPYLNVCNSHVEINLTCSNFYSYIKRKKLQINCENVHFMCDIIFFWLVKTFKLLVKLWQWHVQFVWVRVGKSEMYLKCIWTSDVWSVQTSLDLLWTWGWQNSGASMQHWSGSPRRMMATVRSVDIPSRRQTWRRRWVREEGWLLTPRWSQ